MKRGYAVVLVDVRGRYGSEGAFVPYANEGRDGYDTIEWAAAQPWSTGEIGTFGLSYPGAVQWLAAVESPPHLKAMVPAMTFSTGAQLLLRGRNVGPVLDRLDLGEHRARRAGPREAAGPADRQGSRRGLEGARAGAAVPAAARPTCPS